MILATSTKPWHSPGSGTSGTLTCPSFSTQYATSWSTKTSISLRNNQARCSCQAHRHWRIPLSQYWSQVWISLSSLQIMSSLSWNQLDWCMPRLPLQADSPALPRRELWHNLSSPTAAGAAHWRFSYWINNSVHLWIILLQYIALSFCILQLELDGNTCVMSGWIKCENHDLYISVHTWGKSPVATRIQWISTWNIVSRFRKGRA